MARLQILELPEGAGNERPPFVLVIDEYEGVDVTPGITQESWLLRYQGMAEQIGARAVLVFEESIDIPANDVPVDADGNPLFRAQIQEQIGQALSNVTRAIRGQALADERTDIARDMDRFAKRRDELADALGMDRTRDWDDIRNAAAGIRKQRDAQAAELERLRAGEEPHTDKRITPTPGQWIWQWNRATPEKRLSMAAQIQDGMARSNSCFMADHEAQIERLRAEAERHHATDTPDA